jgi:hypothetical protein
MDFPFGAVQAADAAEQVGKAFEIAGFLQLAAVHDRRKAHHLGARFAIARDQIKQPIHNLLVGAAAAVEAVDTGGQQQFGGQQAHRIVQAVDRVPGLRGDHSIHVDGLSLLVGVRRVAGRVAKGWV